MPRAGINEHSARDHHLMNNAPDGWVFWFYPSDVNKKIIREIKFIILYYCTPKYYATWVNLSLKNTLDHTDAYQWRHKNRVFEYLFCLSFNRKNWGKQRSICLPIEESAGTGRLSASPFQCLRSSSVVVQSASAGVDRRLGARMNPRSPLMRTLRPRR